MEHTPPSNLVLIKGKWYVNVTVPLALRDTLGKQKRLSTGTSDKKIAKQRQHGIAQKLYDTFESTAPRDGFSDLARELLLDHGAPPPPEDMLDKHMDQVSVCLMLQGMGVTIPDGLLALMDPRQRREWLALRRSEDAYSATMSQPLTAPPSSGSVADAAHEYIAGRSWGREATKTKVQRALTHFIDTVAPATVAEITKAHAYRFAQLLDDEGSAAGTIRDKVNAVTGMLKWLERNEQIDANPFVGLDFKGYGRASQRWQPFTKQQLHDLFALDTLPCSDRLLLSILITTGMRLDEAALLSWDNVVEGDVRHFDLTKGIVKNLGSSRLVPIPKALKLPERNTGRLFDYKLDIDGKAQAAASNAVNAHIHQIRSSDRQVAHSLRGTLKDLLRDAGVPKETNDFITGHGAGDVAGKYGSGPSLKVRSEALDKVEHPWLDRP